MIFAFLQNKIPLVNESLKNFLSTKDGKFFDYYASQNNKIINKGLSLLLAVLSWCFKVCVYSCEINVLLLQNRIQSRIFNVAEAVFLTEVTNAFKLIFHVEL